MRQVCSNWTTQATEFPSRPCFKIKLVRIRVKLPHSQSNLKWCSYSSNRVWLTSFNSVKVPLSMDFWKNLCSDFNTCFVRNEINSNEKEMSSAQKSRNLLKKGNISMRSLKLISNDGKRTRKRSTICSKIQVKSSIWTLVVLTWSRQLAPH